MRFELLVNGIPRTYRDLPELAIDAGRFHKQQHPKDELTVINMATREWLTVTDMVFANPEWQLPAEAPATKLRVIS
ncbi:MAG TPA: hypothetical protein VGM66_10540 [Candidatus Udaeobacter sp.]